MKVRTALMWFDNSPRVPLAVKIDEARLAYRAKFGLAPNVCYVNPEDLAGDTVPPDGLAVEPEPGVLRNHFYIGIAGQAP